MWWHSGSEELTVDALRARLIDLPEDWMIHPTESGWVARAPDTSPGRALLLTAIDLSTIISWGHAAHSEFLSGLSFHEDILLSKVEEMERRCKRLEDAQTDRCECLCHRGKQCDHPVTQAEPICTHCGQQAAI